MNLKIARIIDPGVGFKERLLLKVVSDTNVGSYLVVDTAQVEPGVVSTSIKNTYWFPDRNVKTGDTVVLYTKDGKNTTRQELDGSTTWFFYWGKKNTLWTNSDSSAVLMKVDEWEYKIRP